ncbi:AraC family transcriptional regulator [Actinocrispum wychmicini]|uniref:HTH-type transcriptional regulator RipA n=1 Tax=Actinocrispum wychmicini TaxID=1213861 RepID=A0A4R2IKT8_9PSEU|nr:helix-turn-helix transcriptional regulator [Actinocrispum wychmicini]TCO45257.1 AraC-like DNA-binding protein [Actinocrispum wychmicini]
MTETSLVELTVTSSRLLPAGAEIPAHRHRGNQIVYASHGVLAVDTDAGSWVAPASSAIWVPAGVLHGHRAYGVTAFHTVALERRANPLRLAEPTVLEVSPLLREVLIAYTASDSDRRRARLRPVLMDELRPSPQPALWLPTPRDSRLAAVCGLLAGNPADQRSLATLARAAGVGQRTLTRLFAEEFGMSFPQWRTQLRLHLALRLLAEGQSVTATGHRCGWSSTSAFVDVFHRHMGYTPGGRAPR